MLDLLSIYKHTKYNFKCVEVIKIASFIKIVTTIYFTTNNLPLSLHYC